VHDAQKTAKNYDIGWQKVQRLRMRSLGHEPSHTQIARDDALPVAAILRALDIQVG